METLKSVLRSMRRETEERRDHLDIFREFIEHLGRSARCGVGDAKPNDRGGGN